MRANMKAAKKMKNQDSKIDFCNRKYGIRFGSVKIGIAVLYVPVPTRVNAATRAL